MFNKDFYPTPNDVIARMLYGVNILDKIILEPSAGKGNIVNYLQTYGAKEVIACEINQDLAKIVSSKCSLLKNDFLEVESSEISHVDFIIMNPPFSAEERHILHAYEIAPSGCTIISLCNYEVLNNPHTSLKSKVLRLVNEQGRYENFGNCFSTSERTTDTEIGCIWLYKPKSGEDEFEDYFCFEEEIEEQEISITKYNYVRDIVGRYVQAVSMFDKVMEVSNKINQITEPISKYGIKFGAYKTNERQYDSVSRDTYKKELQKQCWMKVFNDMNMDKYVTKKVKESINKFVETQINVPFTMRNIYKMVDLIVGTHENRMKQILVEAFEKICGYSADNSTAGEGWKTNSDYMINRKFIIPHLTRYEEYGYKEPTVKLSYYREDDIDDIVKALCNLTGKNYDGIRPLKRFCQDIENAESKYGYDCHKHKIGMEWGQWYDWSFFRIKAFKKGTIHFEFLDENVWMLFNRTIAQIKGWRLPKQSSSTKKARKKGTGLEVA